jgi:Na+/glutamate symporter
MYGFYKAKRIVLFDTLIEGYKIEDESADKNKNKDESQPTETSESNKSSEQENNEKSDNKDKTCQETKKVIKLKLKIFVCFSFLILINELRRLEKAAQLKRFWLCLLMSLVIGNCLTILKI